MKTVTAIVPALLAGLLLPAAAQAAVTVTVARSGADVVATSTGTLNLSGLTQTYQSYASPAVLGRTGSVFTGIDGPVTGYEGFSGPSSFGTGDMIMPGTGYGFSFGLTGQFPENPAVFVGPGYESDQQIDGYTVFENTSIADLGLTAGTYVYTSEFDTITVRIENEGAVPEPGTWALMLAGFGLVGAGMRARRRSTTVRFA